MNDLKWWGYRHTNGSTQVKRYFDDSYVQDCNESPFVEVYTQPFEASSREDAIKKAELLF